MTMRLLVAILMAVMLTQVAFAAPADEKAAQAAALSWLALVDGGRYGESWDAASSLFKTQVAKAQFEQSLKGVRDSLGAVKSRTLSSAKYMTSLPGAPDGKYVVIQYKTSFAKKASAVETITPMLDKDGKWRVSGYYIK